MPISLKCVDASLVIPLVVNPDNVVLQQVWQQWQSGGQALAAPSLLYYEVTNGIYRYLRTKLLSAAAVRAALAAALALPIEVREVEGLHQAAFDLATRLNLPAAYDAHYLALAERLGAEFWTCDQRLVRAVQADLPWVHLVE